jgi:pyruvate kinase
MVARGDLGVEMDVSRVPIIQKEIVLQCQRVGKPVIIATQMLQSMVDAPVPTRAEVSDVANAILDHTDAVMLSAETAVGKYPLHAVRMMRRIANETESFRTRRFRQHTTEDADGYQIESAVISGASLVARRLKTKLVAAWTRQGQAARLLSKHRMNQPLFAFTPNEAVSRRMALLYGVQPRWVRHEIEPLKELADLDQFLIYQGFAQEGDRILVVSDLRPDLPEEVDSLFIHIVGSGEASLNSQAP